MSDQTKNIFALLRKERNAALLSLDRARIEQYAKKYRIEMPAEEEAFWAEVHKARLRIWDTR